MTRSVPTVLERLSGCWKKIGPRSAYRAIAVSSIALTLVVLEIILRNTVFFTALSYVYDPAWGNLVARGSVVHWALEGWGTTRYVLDGEITTPFHDGASVVVLGDSHTEARQVDDNQNFVSVAEQQLRRGGQQVDLHNLGQEGYTVPDYVYLAPLVAQRYQPKVIVIALWRNDFDVARTFDSTKDNHYVLAADGSLVLKHAAARNQSTAFSNLRRSLTTVDYGIERFNRLKPGVLDRLRQLFRLRAPAESSSLVSRIGSADTVALEVEDLRRAYVGQRVIVLLIPTGPRLEGGGMAFEPPADETHLYDLLRSVPEWHVVYPVDEFAALVTTGELPHGFANTVPGTGHVNVAGHRILGNVLAEALRGLNP